MIPRFSCGTGRPPLGARHLEFAESEPDTSKPVHLIFRSLDYDDYSTNDDLLDIHQST